MALKGDLASVDLAQVFQMLALNKKVGLLSIHSLRLWKVLYFNPRGVSLYLNEHSVLERVLGSLVRTARLDAAALTEARGHAAQMGNSLADSLLAAGYVTAEDMETQTRFELEEEIYDLFFCKDARFEFFEGQDKLEGREGTVDDRFFFNTDSVIMEAARRIDEWSYISERISSPQEVFRTLDVQVDPEVLEGDNQAVLDLIDGRRNVARIVDVSGIASFLVFKSLSQLHEAGCIEALPSEELLQAGKECFAEGRLPDAIALFEKAIEQTLGLEEAHALAAEAYQAAQQFERAGEHLKKDAELRHAAGDLEGAVTRLRAATQLVPTDLAARERLVELTVGNTELSVDGIDPMAEGKILVDLYLVAGDLKRVRTLLERLLRLQPDDLELKKLLVNVHSKAGDQKRVVELYEAIAADLVRGGKRIEAVAYLQKILMVDRSRSDISAKVRALYEFDERARSRRRMLAMLGAGLCAMVALGVVYWFYDRHAADEFDRLDTRQMVEQNDFARAASVYERFLHDFPLTLSVQRAEEELARIESMRKKHEALVASDKAARDHELARLRGEYKSQWVKHRELFKAGDPDASLQCVERVRALVAEAGDQDDLAWALEEQVEQSYLRLKDYLAKAEVLAGEARELLAQNEWQQARQVLVKLISDYDATKTAHAARVPVLITSRPVGGHILQGGKQLVRVVDGKDEPLRTPAVVMCNPWVAENFAIEMEGFERVQFPVKAKDQARLDLVLKVIAERTIRFGSPALTGAAAASDYVVAGLRDGHIGIARRSDGKVLHEIVLGGLRAADSTPIISGGHAYFLSNEGTIECVLLEQGTLAPGWPVKLQNNAATDLCVRDGRVVVIDRNNQLLCFDQANGHQMWMVQLDSAPVGPPTIEKRLVRVGTADGQVRLFDGSTGDGTAAWRSPAGLTTRVLSADGTLFFGCADGDVRAVAEADGRILWSHTVGRPLVDGEMVLLRTGLVIVGGKNQIRLLSRTTGEVRATTVYEGELQKGMVGSGDRLFLTMRFPRDKKSGVYDVLRAFGVEDLGALWEYADSGQFAGPPVSDGGSLLLTDANGEVVLFR